MVLTHVALTLSFAAGVVMPNAPTPAPKPSTAMPLAAHLLDPAAPDGLAGRSDEQLADLVRVSLGRIQLDDEHLALDDPQDIQDLITLAAALEALAGRDVDAPALRGAAVYAAYGCHAVGTAYASSPATRAAVDRLPALAKSPGYQALLTALVGSVRGMRELGRGWFPVALHRALEDRPKAASLHNLRGLWLAREGRHVEAAAAFRQAIELGSKADYGVHLYDELLTLSDHATEPAQRARLADEASALAEKVGGDVPGAAGRLAAVAQRHADEAAVAAYDAPGARRDPASGAEQVARLARLDRGADAQALVRELLDRYPKAPEVLHVAAEVWATGRRYDQLAALCTRAEAEGLFDQRLLEARVAAHAQARMEHLQGQGTAAPAALGDLRADLARYAKLAGPAGDETARALRILLATADAMRAAAQGGKGSQGRAALVLKMAQDALAAHPTSVTTLRVAVGASLSLQAPDKAMALLVSRLPKLASAQRASMTLLLARMELGYGARRRDAALMDRGLGRLAGLRVSQDGDAEDQVALRYTRLVGPLARAALAGTRQAVEDATRAVGKDLGVPSVLEALIALDGLFDRSTEDGRRGALAAALSAGAVALAQGHEGLGRVALKAARRYAGAEDALGLLADGQAQVVDGDLPGAFGRLTRAAALATRPAVRFAARKWVILAANKAGDARAAFDAVGPLLEDWGPAKIPDRVEAGVPLPVFAGDFQVGVGVVHGQPLRPEVTASPLLLLVPDFPAERAWFVELKDKLKGLESGGGG